MTDVVTENLEIMGGPVETDEEWRARKLDEAARERRDRLLRDCDYIMMPDYPLADKAPWEAYRQALRDITLQTDYPYIINWPDAPA
jgi:hypothetical protein